MKGGCVVLPLDECLVFLLQEFGCFIIVYIKPFPVPSLLARPSTSLADCHQLFELAPLFSWVARQCSMSSQLVVQLGLVLLSGVWSFEHLGVE